jgi:hypothetical protein
MGIAETLGIIGRDAKDVVPALLELFRDESFNEIVIKALGRLGPDARAALPLLSELAEKNGVYDDFVAEAAKQIQADSGK